MHELLHAWMSLAGRQLGAAICRPEILSVQKMAAHVALTLDGAQGQSFKVDFWIKWQPEQQPPILLLNTQVKSNSKDDYQAVLELFCEVFPPGTPLTTYVRQSDSLAMLESGLPVRPADLPLVKLFTSAGWQFVSLTQQVATDPKRRHVIRLCTT